MAKITDEQLELLLLCKKYNISKPLAKVYTGLSKYYLEKNYKRKKGKSDRYQSKILNLKAKSNLNNIKKLREYGYSFEDIAVFYNTNKTLIQRICKKYNIKKLPKNQVMNQIIKGTCEHQ